MGRRHPPGAITFSTSTIRHYNQCSQIADLALKAPARISQNQKPTPIAIPAPPVLRPPPEYDEACSITRCAAGRSRFACWGDEGSASFRRDNWGLLLLGSSSPF